VNLILISKTKTDVVHRSTVWRWQERLRLQHSLEPDPHNSGQPKTISNISSLLLVWYVESGPSATLQEMASFLELVNGELFEFHVISRELKVLGFTRKKIWGVSAKRNPRTRTEYWIQGPHALIGWKGNNVLPLR